MKPPLRQPPPKPRPSWWLNVPREQWPSVAQREAERMNAVSTTQHVQRREGDK